MELKNISWVEKYRPKKLSDVIGNFTDKIRNYLDNSEAMPNFLFYSKTPGTGKTTLAKTIINELECDHLILNASDDRTLDVVRTKIKDFSRTKATNGRKKCCFLDEFDGNLKATQEAMRNLMETYANNIFFILTCNNINKVIEPIQSRCVVIEFTKPNKEDIFNRLKSIASDEALETDDEGIKKLIDMNYPSIRNCINYMQDLKIDGKPLTSETVSSYTNDFDVIWDLINNKDYQSIKQKIIKENTDCRSLNQYLFDKIINGNLSLVKEAKIIKILAKMEVDFTRGADESIVMLSNILDIIMVLTKQESSQREE